MLGLFAFFYASLHLLTYVVLDRASRSSSSCADVAKRPFITAGMVAFRLMVPLAMTSTKGWIRRLGRSWQVLHRLVYLQRASRPACTSSGRSRWSIGEPVYYAAILAVLLAFRRRLAAPPGRRPAPPACPGLESGL